MINLKSLFDSLFFIIITLDQIFTRYIVFSFFFRWIKLDVISPPRARVNASSREPVDNFFIIDINLDYMI